jgi:hypothetical protein
VDVFANNYGDCKDMTTLLVAMLREAGVTAHPVLLRAGSTDKVSDDLPSPGAFNHALCLAEIGGKKFWLDATAELCPWGAIPGGDRGAEAFVIRDGVGAFEVIPHAAPDENRIEQNITLALAEDGSAKGTVRLTGTGDRDMELRAAFTYLRPDKVKDFLERMAQSIGPNARVGAYTISDFRNKDLPISVTYDITLPSWAKKSGSLLLFKAKPEQSGGSSSSPFQRDQRRHPVLQPSAALGASTLDLTLPPGFSILSLPDGSEVKSDLGRFRRTIASRDDRITISVRGENFRADVPPGPLRRGAPVLRRVPEGRRRDDRHQEGLAATGRGGERTRKGRPHEVRAALSHDVNSRRSHRETAPCRVPPHRTAGVYSFRRVSEIGSLNAPGVRRARAGNAGASRSGRQDDLVAGPVRVLDPFVLEGAGILLQILVEPFVVEKRNRSVGRVCSTSRKTCARNNGPVFGAYSSSSTGEKSRNFTRLISSSRAVIWRRLPVSSVCTNRYSLSSCRVNVQVASESSGFQTPTKWVSKIRSLSV